MALRDILISFQIEVDQTPLLEAEKKVSGLIDTFKTLGNVAKVVAAGLFVKELADASDEYTHLSNSLRAVTKSADDFEEAQRGVFRIARDTLEPVADIADSFRRFSFATQDLGLSTGETLEFTENLARAIKLSGTDATETNAAMRELSHGLTTNFAGSSRELRALQKNAPLLARIIAESLGGSAADFVEFGRQGRITSRVFVDAVRASRAQLDLLWKKRTPLFSELRTSVWNDFLAVIKQLTPALDRVKGYLGDVVGWIHDWVDDGSALNSVIAAAIMGVGALAVAMGPLVLEAAAAAAPFVALFLALDDLVTFLAGGDSLLGRGLDKFFGDGAADKTRQFLTDVWDGFRDFVSWLSDPNTWRSFAETLNAIVRRIFGSKVSDALGIGDIKAERLDREAANPNQDTVPLPPALTDAGMGAQSTQPEEIKPFFGRGGGFDQAAATALTTDYDLDPMGNPMMPGSGGGTATPPGALDPGMWSDFAKAFQGWHAFGLNGSAPALSSAGGTTNNGPVTNTTGPISVVVQGDAGAQTARDVAERTGAAVSAAAMGRDRAAIMSSLPGGVQ